MLQLLQVSVLKCVACRNPKWFPLADRTRVKMVTCVCVLLAQLEPNISQVALCAHAGLLQQKTERNCTGGQGSHRHVCPSSSTIAPVALPPLLAIIACGLGIPHGSRKQQTHSTQSYSQKDPDRVFQRPRGRSGDMRVTDEQLVIEKKKSCCCWQKKIFARNAHMRDVSPHTVSQFRKNVEIVINADKRKHRWAQRRARLLDAME